MAPNILLKIINISPVNQGTYKLFLNFPYYAFTLPKATPFEANAPDILENNKKNMTEELLTDASLEKSPLNVSFQPSGQDLRNDDFSYISSCYTHVCSFDDNEFKGDIVDIINMPETVSVNINELSDERCYYID